MTEAIPAYVQTSQSQKWDANLLETMYYTPLTVLVWGSLSQFPPFRYFPNFSALSNSRKLLNSTFIFGRCRHSWAAVTPVKYECDSNNLTCTFEISNISVTEKLMHGALVTPTPDVSRIGLCSSLPWANILGVSTIITVTPLHRE